MDNRRCKLLLAASMVLNLVILSAGGYWVYKNSGYSSLRAKSGVDGTNQQEKWLANPWYLERSRLCDVYRPLSGFRNAGGRARRKLTYDGLDLSTKGYHLWKSLLEHYMQQ